MHDIVHELTIEAPPEAVFTAITTADGLASWWTTDATADPELGGTATFGFDDGATRLTMRIDAIDAPELVHWNCTGGPEEWVGTSVAFRIEPSPGGGTVVRFWHGGWEYADGALPRCSFDWAMHLDSLRAYLQTGTGRPHQAGAAS